jgi:hypothetical protein
MISYVIGLSVRQKLKLLNPFKKNKMLKLPILHAVLVQSCSDGNSIISRCNSLRICHNDNLYHRCFLYSFRTFRYPAIKMASYFMRNMFWSGRICFGPTDFHILSDRMSDSFSTFGKSEIHTNQHMHDVQVLH